MKLLAMLTFLSVGPLAFAGENILLNSDFSDGVNHWDGDIHSQGMVSNPGADPASHAPVIELRGDWAHVSQEFEAKRGVYFLSVTYELSPGTTFMDKRADYRNITGKVDFTHYRPLSIKPGEWVILIAESPKRGEAIPIKPALISSVPQTLSTNLEIKGKGTKTLCLAFPPGDGLITLINISLNHGRVRGAGSLKNPSDTSL